MVNPKIWGRSAWIFLISTVADYPDNPNVDMQYNYNRYFLHLKWVLPCDVCRSNYEDHFRKWPIDQYLKSRAALFRWIMIIYNEVQSSLNKKTKGPQELLYELFGPEEGERMMQRLVYEDPDANITVIKPFDPTIDQYGGSKNTDNAKMVGGLSKSYDTMVKSDQNELSLPPRSADSSKSLKISQTIRYPSMISNLSPSIQSTNQEQEVQGLSTNKWTMTFIIILLLLLLAYYLFKK